MKSKFIALAICVSLFAGCVHFQNAGKSVGEWWKRPSTQEHLVHVQQAIVAAILAGGAESVRELITTGTVDPYKVGMAATASVLWQQSGNLRKLQGTAQVLDPDATARALIESGTPKEAVTKLANQIVDNTKTLINAGMPPDAAAEFVAASLDIQAAIEQNATVVK